MKEINLFNDKGIITKEAIEKLSIIGATASCECPKHLIDILKAVQEFTEYQENCINNTPQDIHTHAWLMATSKNLEHMVSSTIVNLARLEGIIDHNNKIIQED
ncbi:hypothetical protein M899_3261 [Bacteriovorax sp. BSW11_IV]|uniref:hypothetical protein n=1 Tax=Bacteriovorax sp. BSW11_IV TaxID=1353529 RepID=UPI00038A4B2F|nr:hypothetical protein [Bacteriovorax sp. BSW11_IV]EQC48266.1 hypothetical protein M899_3261 [Bacteriovorax sp. BSW11_IV]